MSSVLDKYNVSQIWVFMLFICAFLAICPNPRTNADEPKLEVPLEVCKSLLRSADERGGVVTLNQSEVAVLVDSLRGAMEQHVDADHTARVRHHGLLLDIYNLSSTEDSYLAFIIAEMAKRVLLDSARFGVAAIAEQPDPTAAELNAIREALRGVPLDPAKLKVLVADNVDDGIEDPFPEEDIVEAVSALSRSYGYDSRHHWTTEMYTNKLWEMYRGVPPTLESMMSEENREWVLLRSLESEMIRQMIDGAIEFLLRGGDPDIISTHDVRPFHEVISVRDARAFAFPALGMHFVGASRVLSVLDIENKRETSDIAVWIRRTTFQGHQPDNAAEDNAAQPNR